MAKPPIPFGRTPAPRRKAVKAPISARTLRDLSRAQRMLREETRAAIDEIKQSSDRAACILMSAMVERHLERSILLRLMIPGGDDKTSALFERDGALSTFYGNTHLAYALDLITSEMKSDLDIIRRVRNAFAHSQLPVSFQSQEISREIAKLNHKAYSIFKEDEYTSGSGTQKLIFMSCSLSIMIALTDATGKFLDIQSTLISALKITPR
jgi:hypothetical protein